MPGRACHPGYGGAILLFSCWDWNGAELTELCRLVQQLQSLLVFPLSHVGEEADKAGPGLGAMLLPLHRSLQGTVAGAHLGVRLEPRISFLSSTNTFLCVVSCWENLHREGLVNRSCVKNRPLMVDEGEDVPCSISQRFPDFLKPLHDVPCFKTRSDTDF